MTPIARSRRTAKTSCTSGYPCLPKIGVLRFHEGRSHGYRRNVGGGPRFRSAGPIQSDAAVIVPSYVLKLVISNPAITTRINVGGPV